MNSLYLEYPRGIGNRSNYREFRVIESQMLGWLALGADENVQVKKSFEFRDSSSREFLMRVY